MLNTRKKLFKVTYISNYNEYKLNNRMSLNKKSKDFTAIQNIEIFTLHDIIKYFIQLTKKAKVSLTGEIQSFSMLIFITVKMNISP